MNRKKTHTLAKFFFGMLFTSTNAVAAPYVGVTYAYSNAEYLPKEAQVFSDGNPSLIQLQGGYFFSDYFALEARYGTSLQRSSGLNVDSLASALIKANFPVSPQVSVYGLAGYSFYSMDKQGMGTIEDQGVSFGVGMHYAFDNRTAVILDFVNYANGDEARLNSINLGFQYKF